MGRRIDLNADMGEGFGAWTMGADQELLGFVTSANVACGFHAGDPAVIDRTVGLAIRAGVHTGEIELAGNERHGIAVHVGARVAALAGPSEILVTRTVKDLTAGSDLAFADAGEHDLKGVPERWHLYRLVE